MTWGKLRFDESGHILAAHPLLAHLADVAAVMEALVRLPGFRLRLEDVARHRLNEGLTSRICVLAALHDIGKLAPCFQGKFDPSRSDACGHIEALKGLTHNGCRPLLEAYPWLPTWDDAGGQVVIHYMDAAFSHHGRPGSFIDPKWSLAERQRSFEGHWRSGKTGALVELADLASDLERWFPAAFFDNAPPLPNSSPLQHLFAGLIILSDWIASDERFFPFCGEHDRPGPEADPIVYAREAATRALVETGIDIQAARPARPLRFEDVFPFSPNDLQHAVDGLPLPGPGSLVVIEAETGGGKTEAALWYFLRLFSAGIVDGLYFANPLRFAATQLHSRVIEAMTRAFGKGRLPVTLAVPGYTKVDEAIGYHLPGFQVLWNDPDEPVLRRQGWASESPKRFLTAPAAVGTIDQALLAGLRVPHAHLRMAGLSRSLLVIDEVHASDAYMTGLTLGVLDMFRRCGGHVLLMSATLGGAARARYVQAMTSDRWTRSETPSFSDSLAVDYPRITIPDREVLIPGKSRQKNKQVALRLEPVQDDPLAVATLAADLVRRGACVLVLRNTVRQAVSTAVALESELGPEHPALFAMNGRPAMHHSRFAREDRLLLDDRVVELFGKRDEEQRRMVRPPGVVTATQTLEQSLDVDFDAIVTDLAPMDVMLQRFGRVFRHAHARPPGFEGPLSVVLIPETPAFLVSQAAGSYNYGLDRAYEDPVILEATRRLLADKAQTGGLLIPAMNRELVERATHPEEIDRLAGEMGEAFAKTRRGARGARTASGMLAGVHRIDWAKPFGPDAAPMEESKAKTRLGLDDLRAWLDEPVLGPFGLPVQNFVIPSFLSRNAAPDESLRLIDDKGPSLVLQFAGTKLRYDRFGLRQWEDEP